MDTPTSPSLNDIEASTHVLAFDIFGTVVDWHGSIVREVQTRYPAVDANAFALAWRAGYQPAMARVRSGELGWTRIDELHRLILEDLLPSFGLTHLSEAERVHLNRVWHRLDAWPDSVKGLLRLKKKFTICSLSNGNLGLLHLEISFAIAALKVLDTLHPCAETRKYFRSKLTYSKNDEYTCNAYAY
jgi:2-haloacid dehalogenase